MIQREPDDNGVDDPPVAVDDPVTARSSSSVQVQVTANDWDPDGEAIAVSLVGQAGHGDVEIADASTVVYTPDAGYVGRDQFDYSIVDGNGTEDSATVVVELLPSGDELATRGHCRMTPRPGPRSPVVVEVLLNDVDPERDGLRIGSFTPPDNATVGEVTETLGDSGLPALKFVPAAVSKEPRRSRTGRSTRSAARVTTSTSVSTWPRRQANRPPVTRPDAVRARRNKVIPRCRCW